MIKNILFVLPCLICASATDQPYMSSTWASVPDMQPDGMNVWDACSECDTMDDCKMWCDTAVGCESLSWSENWKTCQGYEEVQVDNLVAAVAPNSFYIFRGLPSPSPAAVVLSGSVEKRFVPNHPPTLAASLNTQEAQVGQPFYVDLHGHFVDIDGDVLDYQTEGLPVGVKCADGTLQGTPKKEGRFKVTITAGDGKAYPAKMPPFWLVVKDSSGRLPPMLSEDDWAKSQEKKAAHQLLKTGTRKGGKGKGKGKGEGKGKGKGKGKGEGEGKGKGKGKGEGTEEPEFAASVVEDTEVTLTEVKPVVKTNATKAVADAKPAAEATTEF